MGTGYDQTRSLQWVDLCPHLGAPERTLLKVLANLTTDTNPVCTLALDELRTLVYAAPVAVGEHPKTISSSGLLRNLVTLHQITTPEGQPLTFSSRTVAHQRPVAIQVWLTPTHECGCPRNVEDALAQAQGQPPQFDPATAHIGR